MGMIKSEREYSVTKEKITALKTSIKNSSQHAKLPLQLAKLAVMGEQAFCQQLEDEVKEYESIKSGKIPQYFFQLENLGLLLIALRIKAGLTQSELAKKLNVSQAQVSRDENNDYHGVGLVKIKEILKVLDVHLEVKIKA
jgi:DNA-binding XRE family transcriptional regulator